MNMAGDGEEDALTHLLRAGQALLQAYGWYAVLGLLALYLLRPRLQDLRRELSLRQANNPARRRILDEELRRVRLEQQMELLRSVSKDVAQVEGETEEGGAGRGGSVPAKVEKPRPPTLKRRAVAKPVKREEEESSFNPLLGGGGGSSFRPSSSARNKSSRKGA